MLDVEVALGESCCPLPFAPGHPHPGPLPLSGRGDLFIAGDGFSWRKRLWEWDCWRVHWVL